MFVAVVAVRNSSADNTAVDARPDKTNSASAAGAEKCARSEIAYGTTPTRLWWWKRFRTFDTM